ncbi:MAG: chorion class high-cysteine HCB protein 13 [Clostridiales bacterium]|nr:chorion class high-cysteine HCB protein 13 [Clostridiales bacterium]
MIFGGDNPILTLLILSLLFNDGCGFCGDSCDSIIWLLLLSRCFGGFNGGITTASAAAHGCNCGCGCPR